MVNVLGGGEQQPKSLRTERSRNRGLRMDGICVPPYSPDCCPTSKVPWLTFLYPTCHCQHPPGHFVYKKNSSPVICACKRNNAAFFHWPMRAIFVPPLGTPEKAGVMQPFCPHVGPEIDGRGYAATF